MVNDDVEASDVLWYEAYPQLLADNQGTQVETMIDQIEVAVAAYGSMLQKAGWDRTSPIARATLNQIIKFQDIVCPVGCTRPLSIGSASASGVPSLPQGGRRG